MAEMTAAEAQGFFHPKHGEIVTFEGGLNYIPPRIIPYKSKKTLPYKIQTMIPVYGKNSK